MLSATAETLAVRLVGAEVAQEELGLAAQDAAEKQAQAEVRGIVLCVAFNS